MPALLISVCWTDFCLRALGLQGAGGAAHDHWNIAQSAVVDENVQLGAKRPWPNRLQEAGQLAAPGRQIEWFVVVLRTEAAVRASALTQADNANRPA